MNWVHKLTLKDAVLDNTKDTFTVAEIRAKTKKFWSIVESHNSFMAEFVDEFKDFYSASTINTLEEFNELLDHLYDYCDWRLIWVQ